MTKSGARGVEGGEREKGTKIQCEQQEGELKRLAFWKAKSEPSQCWMMPETTAEMRIRYCMGPWMKCSKSSLAVDFFVSCSELGPYCSSLREMGDQKMKMGRGRGR